MSLKLELRDELLYEFNKLSPEHKYKIFRYVETELPSKLTPTTFEKLCSTDAILTAYNTVVKIRSASGTRIEAFNKPSKIESISQVVPKLVTREHTRFEDALCLLSYFNVVNPSIILWGEKNVLNKESMALDQLNKAIQSILTKRRFVKLYIDKNHIFRITKAFKVEGTPRADFLLTNNRNSYLYVSHKDGTGVNGFQQYSGMTKELPIRNHPEVIQFVEKIRDYMGGEFTKDFKANYSTKIKDYDLAAYSMFGKNYKLTANEDNCQIIVQGEIGFNQIETNLYTLSCSHSILNPQINPSKFNPETLKEYWPYLHVRREYKANYMNIKSARFMIMAFRNDCIDGEKNFNAIL